jgi:putative two-component system hydrogenase maturation factor HypX/HoxX
LSTDTHLTIAALQGSAAAGGFFLALAADRVVARDGIVLNPHYRNMGNLYGSEYWTYLLPRRVGSETGHSIMARRLPLCTSEAFSLGLIDDHAGPEVTVFRALIESHADSMAQGDAFPQLLADKRARRALDESLRPLADYRSEELGRMRMNFYGFDPSYHIARHRFVHRTPHAWTPLHLAKHRVLTAPVRGMPGEA